ncbi:TnsA endonuclease N-terminal domain-containing protein [Vogesella amnigena]|uniref:TnsA endonuclease N-terminal domain-containing protein n=1 Tax=Vogesella amnigena TaxID=1507449 RepID=A0ABV7TVS3_9NEIS
MRTTKRFTPTVLERFRKEGRGTGIYAEYIPWHRVSRGDPASLGRSHLLNWRGRQRELLSDGELIMTLFVTMQPGIHDLREQFPLSLKTAHHEMCDYYPGSISQGFPGTQDIADQLGHKHPKTTGNGEAAPWVMSTDLVLVLQQPNGRLELLAIAYKTAEELKSPRKIQLLEIEQAYWQVRNVQWLLITPNQYDKRVGLALRRIAPWALDIPAPENVITLVANTVQTLPEQSLTSILRYLSNVTGEMELSQRALWQAVCLGYLPIDLTRGWRPHLLLKCLDQPAFLAQNPIVMRRTAWT